MGTGLLITTDRAFRYQLSHRENPSPSVPRKWYHCRKARYGLEHGPFPFGGQTTCTLQSALTPTPYFPQLTVRALPRLPRFRQSSASARSHSVTGGRRWKGRVCKGAVFAVAFCPPAEGETPSGLPAGRQRYIDSNTELHVRIMGETPMPRERRTG